jgi:hypothetical protein
MVEVGLRLHPDKTKVVYCQDERRRGSHECTSFTFLGYTFRPRTTRRPGSRPFVVFTPAVSPPAMKKMGQVVRGWRLHHRTGLSLDELARMINPIVASWINYYGRFRRSQIYPLLQRINTYLMRWAGQKYKRLRAYRRFQRWWTGILDRDLGLFTHWRHVRTFAGLR